MAKNAAERVKGIEPSSSTWEDDVLPLNYTRRKRYNNGIISYGDREMALCTINGEIKETGAHTVAELLAEMNLRGRKIAVEKNGAVVPRSMHDSESLADGDILEIVGAVGGG